MFDSEQAVAELVRLGLAEIAASPQNPSPDSSGGGGVNSVHVMPGGAGDGPAVQHSSYTVVDRRTAMRLVQQPAALGWTAVAAR